MNKKTDKKVEGEVKSDLDGEEEDSLDELIKKKN